MSPVALPDTPQTPDEYRRRYFELKARAQEANANRAKSVHGERHPRIPKDAVLLEETIPAECYWTNRISRSHTLRVINDGPTDGVSLLIWSAQDPTERFNPADSIKVQWTARLTRGRLLLSDMGRVLASITDDTCGHHDFVAGCSTRSSNARKFGEAPGQRNSRDNFILAASKHGLTARDVGPCLTLFAPVVTDESGKLLWKDGALKSGDYVDLRAEMDIIVALSNCPHPLSSSKDARSIRAAVWRSPNPARDDYCRTATEEAVRAFENTDSTFRP